MIRAIVVLLLATPGFALDSGPKEGEKAEPFAAFGVVGPVEGKEADYVKDRKDEPTVYLFVQHSKFDRPMARFIKGIDAIDNNKTKVVAVWLTDNVDSAKEYLPKVNMSLQFAHTALTVFDGTAGPNGWGLNGDAHITAVVVNKGKVVVSLGYQSVNETDVAKVKEALEKIK